MTPLGFFSAVEHRDAPGDVLVRARVRLDLVNLLDCAGDPDITIERTLGADYPFRARMSKTRWATLCMLLAETIDYPNFKSEVARVQGAQRASTYTSVWHRLLDLEREDPELRDITPFRLTGGGGGGL